MTLEFMFMKHYAPNRCEPSIEVIMKIGVQLGGGGGGGGVGFIYYYYFIIIIIIIIIIFFFFFGGGVSGWM